MYRFLITASILVLLGFIYLGSRLIVPSLPLAARITLWIILGAMIANLLWLPFKRWQRQSGTQLTGAATRWLEASAYNLMGFDTLTFTPLFVAARVVGWTAHIMEQAASNALIRPLSCWTAELCNRRRKAVHAPDLMEPNDAAAARSILP